MYCGLGRTILFLGFFLMFTLRYLFRFLPVHLFAFVLISLLKTTFEDVFPAEATTVEEYLQQVTSSF